MNREQAISKLRQLVVAASQLGGTVTPPGKRVSVFGLTKYGRITTTNHIRLFIVLPDLIVGPQVTEITNLLATAANIRLVHDGLSVKANLTDVVQQLQPMVDSEGIQLRALSLGSSCI